MGGPHAALRRQPLHPLHLRGAAPSPSVVTPLSQAAVLTGSLFGRCCRHHVQIHWLSIINSFVLVLLLTAFLAVILMRVLKNDFSRYMEMDEVRPRGYCLGHGGTCWSWWQSIIGRGHWCQDDIVEEESGWKLIHGDVFRFPSQINLFSALIGSGVQVGE